MNGKKWAALAIGAGTVAAAAAIKVYRTYCDRQLWYARFPGDADGEARRHFKARAGYASKRTLDEIRLRSLQEPLYFM